MILIAAGRGLRFDRAVAQWIQQLGVGWPWLHDFMLVITHFGDTASMISVTILVAALLVRLTNGRRASFTMLLALAIAWISNNLIKFLFARERPQLSTLFVDPTSYSFPSGHAMISTAVYGCAALLLSEALPRFKWLIVPVALLLAFFVGTSRIYLDAHWPSDVVAGFAGGWMTISLVRIILPAQSAPR